jgi:ribonuclease Z
MGPPRPGRKFSFVTDTSYFPDIAEKVSGADFLICEGMFRDELEASAAEKKHLTATQAANIAREAGGVRKMGLIHYSPRYTEHELKKLLKEARSIFPDTVLTRDRQVYPIYYRDG